MVCLLSFSFFLFRRGGGEVGGGGGEGGGGEGGKGLFLEVEEVEGFGSLGEGGTEGGGVLLGELFKVGGWVGGLTLSFST